MIVDVMDKLKQEILKAFNKYQYKLKRGYYLDEAEYGNIVEAMRWVNTLENYTFPDFTVEAIISRQLLNLRNK